MQLFFDRDGKPITLDQWMNLTIDRDYVVVAFTKDDGWAVSTVWTGLNSSPFSASAPIIFETMIFAAGTSVHHWTARYRTREEAIAGHDQAVATIRDAETKGLFK